MCSDQSLLSHIQKNLVYAGSGEKSTFYHWEYGPNDLYFVFPGHRILAIYRQDTGRFQFFKIVNDTKDIPVGCKNVIEKISYDEDGDMFFEAFYCEISAHDIVHKFAKKYKFLLYHIDELI